jgi:hypothetical protein
MRNIAIEFAVILVVIVVVWAHGVSVGWRAAVDHAASIPEVCLTLGGVIDGDQYGTVCLTPCEEPP